MVDECKNKECLEAVWITYKERYSECAYYDSVVGRCSTFSNSALIAVIAVIYTNSLERTIESVQDLSG
jgi:hypothetical protein